MLKKTFAALALVALAATVMAATGTYGEGVSLSETTAVSAILEAPGNYVGKTVLINGLVVNVCAARGCWMELAGDQPYQKIRVKVEDGAIVFPMSARGKRASVQGLVEKMPLCPDEEALFLKEYGGKIPSSHISIRATGAAIE